MNLNHFYGLDKVRKDKNIFQTFANKTEINNHLLNIGIISLDEFKKREHGRLSNKELDDLVTLLICLNQNSTTWMKVD